MTSGVLGVIACPMLEDNLIYSVESDSEEKHITLIENIYNTSIKDKMERKNIVFDTISEDSFFNGEYKPITDAFNIVILMKSLGLHAEPKVLKTDIEEEVKKFQPYVDVLGLYYGTCGNYGWDIPKWCKENGYKPATMFYDRDKNPIDDCVGVAVGGTKQYLNMQKAYTGYLYLFPAMATNYEDLVNSDATGQKKAIERLDPEQKQALGIEDGPDGYMRWLLKIGNYQHILKIDTGIGDIENFDDAVNEVSKRVNLSVVVPDENLSTLDPTNDIYAECKLLLKEQKEACQNFSLTV